MVKEFTYRGKTIEELKNLTVNEFAKLVNARQRRSILRGFTTQEKKLLLRIKKFNKGENKKQIKTHCRDLIVFPEMVGLLIYVYDGKLFVPVSIMPEMIGHYLGEFTVNRRKVKHSAPGIGATRSSAAVSVK